MSFSVIDSDSYYYLYIIHISINLIRILIILIIIAVDNEFSKFVYLMYGVYCYYYLVYWCIQVEWEFKNLSVTCYAETKHFARLAKEMFQWKRK